MSDALSRKGQFEPIHAAHAIEQVVFVVQIDHPLDDESFAEIRKATEQFKSESDLPKQAESKSVRFGVQFAFDGSPPNQLGPIPVPTSVGYELKRMAPDGTVEKELRIDRTSITFRTTRYTRWDDVWEQARKYFDATVPKYVAQTSISGISLNYVDKFIWSGDISDCRPNLLLRPGSEYLCPHIYVAQDLWHSHTGAFLRINDEIKRLFNIHVDYLDEKISENLRRSIVIKTLLTNKLNQPGYTPSSIVFGSGVGTLDSHMQELHAAGKILFGNIISDEMSKRIALIQ